MGYENKVEIFSKFISVAFSCVKFMVINRAKYEINRFVTKYTTFERVKEFSKQIRLIQDNL